MELDNMNDLNEYVNKILFKLQGVETAQENSKVSDKAETQQESSAETAETPPARSARSSVLCFFTSWCSER